MSAKNTIPRSYAFRLHSRARDSRGVALIMSLGMLVLFAALGIAYVGAMKQAHDNAAFSLNQQRMRNAARSGVEAALAKLEKSIQADETITLDLLDTISTQLPLPVYVEAKKELVVSDTKSLVCTVQVADESARVNLNHAPRGVLHAILNFSAEEREKSRKIVSRLPRPDEIAQGVAPDGERRWLLSPDDLVSRDLVDRADWANRIDATLLTVHTVLDHADPEAYINLNSASAPVLAAVLDVPLEIAEAATQGRPFASIDAVAAAVGKGPSAFGITAPMETPAAMPRELALTSRCFRITSEVSMETSSGPELTDRVEAVVIFDADNRPVVRYWNENK